MAWVKFWYLGDGGPGQKSALTCTIILSCAIIGFAWFGFHTYRTMIRVFLSKASQEVDEIENNIKTVSAILHESGIWGPNDSEEVKVAAKVAASTKKSRKCQV